MTNKDIAEKMQEDAFMKDCNISVLVEDWKDEIFVSVNFRLIKYFLPQRNESYQSLSYLSFLCGLIFL